MTARTDRKPDRDFLITLAGSLSVSQGRLRRDPCGDWTIVGRHGHALTDGTDAFVYLPAGTARRWEKAKRLLNFAVVTQDGDDDGVLKLINMPTPEQAGVLRKLLGMRKASPLTDERRTSLISVGFSQAKPPVPDGFIASGQVAATLPPSALPARIDEPAPICTAPLATAADDR
jgi:hypothetical protein